MTYPGGSIYDTATIIGANTPGPTGNIWFYLYGPNDPLCAGPSLIGAAPADRAVNGPSTYYSVLFTATAPGAYHWRAYYGGDASNNPATTQCGDSGETSFVAALDQYQGSIAGNSVVGQGGYMALQSFTAGLTGQLVQVALALSRQGNPGDLIVDIDSVQPDGTPASFLARALPVSIPDTGGGGFQWYTMTLDRSVPITAGSKYAIVASAPNSLACPPWSIDCASSNYRWMLGAPKPYTRGDASSSPDSGVTWNPDSYVSRTFATYVVVGPVESRTLAPGQTLSTVAPTSSNPVQTAVTLPSTPPGGSVSIVQTSTTFPPPTGFLFLNQQVVITAPAASSGSPLTITFTLDASLFPSNVPVPVALYRSEAAGPVFVPTCNLPNIASPDPCVVSEAVGASSVTIVVLTSHASTWNFALSTVKPTPVISWSNPADIVFGTALSSTAQLNATANVPGRFSYNYQVGTVLHAGLGQLLATSFAPTETSKYNDAGATVRINVLKANQTISFATPPDQVFGAIPLTLRASTNAGLPVNLTAAGQCTITAASGGPLLVAGTAVTISGGGSCSITASQSGNADYNAAPSVTRSFNVACLAAQMPFALALTGASSVSATLSFPDQRPTPGGGCSGPFAVSLQVGRSTIAAGSGTFTATTTGPVVTANLLGSVAGSSPPTAFSATLTLDTSHQTGTIAEVFSTDHGPITVRVTFAKVGGTYVTISVQVAPPPVAVT